MRKSNKRERASGDSCPNEEPKRECFDPRILGSQPPDESLFSNELPQVLTREKEDDLQADDEAPGIQNDSCNAFLLWDNDYEQHVEGLVVIPVETLLAWRLQT